MNKNESYSGSKKFLTDDTNKNKWIVRCVQNKIIDNISHNRFEFQLPLLQ